MKKSISAAPEADQWISCTKITPGYLVHYNQYYGRSEKVKSAFTLPTFRHYEIQKRNRTKIRNAVLWMNTLTNDKWIYSRKEKKKFKFRINFITLTLSEKQKISDQVVKDKMLTPFIEWLQRKHDVKMYVWKAEAQLNGNIHFHITIDRFIHWRAIRAKWNSIQIKAGQYNSFLTPDGYEDKNSTDVHSCKNPNEVARYLGGYITKSDMLHKSAPKEIKELFKKEYDHETQKEIYNPEKSYQILYCAADISRWLLRPIEGRRFAISESLSDFKVTLTSEESDYTELNNFFLRNWITKEYSVERGKISIIKPLSLCASHDRIIDALLNEMSYRKIEIRNSEHHYIESFK